MAQLVFIGGRSVGSIVTLSPQNRIGRAADNEIVLEEPGVRDTHAIIHFGDGSYHIDSRSDAPVNVNGKAVRSEELRHGDIITLGAVTVLFSDETSPSTPATPAPIVPDAATRSVVESHIAHFQDAEDALSAIKKSERLSNHLENLYRFGSAVSATLRMDDLMNVLIGMTFDLFRPDRAFVFLSDERRNLHLQSQRISEQSRLKGFDRVSKTILNEAIEKREAFLTKDATSETRLNVTQSIVDQNIQSAMCVPMVKKDHILGVIYLDTLTAFTTYTREDLHLMNAVAAQAALAIENVLSYVRQLEHSRKLVTLGDISRRISSFLSRDIVIREAVDGTSKLFDCRKCSILLLDETEQSLVVAGSNCIDRKLWETLRIAPGEGHCGRVFRDNQPLRITDAPAGPPERKYESSSFMIVPILARTEGLQAQSRPVGVMTATDKADRGDFTPDDLELLSVLAGQVGIALNNARLFERATVDGLTRVFTRPFFFSQLREEIAAHRVRNAPLTVLMFDLDHFKDINDKYLHQTGDRVLTELGKLLRDEFTHLGMVARYGGEEFVVMLRSSPVGRAKEIAEKVRSAVEAYPFVSRENPIRCTVSIGISQLEEGDDMDQIVRKADAALYQAKRSGRNRVETGVTDAEAQLTQTGHTRRHPRPPE